MNEFHLIFYISVPCLALNLALQGNASLRSRGPKEFQGYLNKTAAFHCSPPLISISTAQHWTVEETAEEVIFLSLRRKGGTEMMVWTCRQQWSYKVSDYTFYK